MISPEHKQVGQPTNVALTLHQFNDCRNPYKPDVAEDVAAIGPEACHPLLVLAEGFAE
jgi:hypothetical protein